MCVHRRHVPGISATIYALSLNVQNKLDLVAMDDLNGKTSAVLNHLIAVNGFIRGIPSLLDANARGSAGTAIDSSGRLKALAAKLIETASTEPLCERLIESLQTVTENVTELQELFAAGTGERHSVTAPHLSSVCVCIFLDGFADRMLTCRGTGETRFAICHLEGCEVHEHWQVSGSLFVTGLYSSRRRAGAAARPRRHRHRS